MTSDLYTIPEAAERLGVSRATLYRLVLAGAIPEAIKVGRQWRISRPRLEQRLHGEQAS